MGLCDCCGRNEGFVRTWATTQVDAGEGRAPKRVPKETLCDACNDGQYPYFTSGDDGTNVLVCPHEVEDPGRPNLSRQGTR
jgi:hypothetical protein